MQGIRVIKSFNQQTNEEKRFGEVADDMNDLNIKIGYVFFMLIASLFLGLQCGDHRRCLSSWDKRGK